jgi:mannan endo-1,4-beta-mannosidase
MEIANRASLLRSGTGRRAVAATGLIVLALACLGSPTPSSAAPAHGHQGKTHKAGSSQRRARKPRPSYWGAWIGDNLTGAKPPWDMSAVTSFEQLTGRGLSLVEFASPFYECGTSPCTPLRFPTAEMESIRNYGAIPFLSWGSDSIPVPEVPSEPDFRLANVIAGNYDGYIREFAEAARDWGHPFFLRFNWEMNGNWFPWGQNVNGNQASETVAAWRHVHDIFTSVGATNATWVWCPYADPFHRFGDLKQLYPGDEYVDWTSMDGFNWASNPTNPHPWKSFDQIFSSTYKSIMQIAPKKPMILAEIASTGSGRAKAAWIDNMFKVLASKYRRIRGLIWFDQVDRGISWPLETAPRATRAFSRGIQHWAYQANSYATASVSPVQPPG